MKPVSVEDGIKSMRTLTYGPYGVRHPRLWPRVPVSWRLQRLLLHKSVLENSRLRHRSRALGARACQTDYLAKPPINTTRPTGSYPLVWFSVSKSCPSPPECFIHNAKCSLQNFFKKVFGWTWQSLENSGPSGGGKERADRTQANCPGPASHYA